MRGYYVKLLPRFRDRKQDLKQYELPWIAKRFNEKAPCVAMWKRGLEI